MGVVIEIPSALKQFVNDQDEVEVSGSSVEEAFGELVSEFIELKGNLFDENDKILHDQLKKECELVLLNNR